MEELSERTKGIITIIVMVLVLAFLIASCTASCDQDSYSSKSNYKSGGSRCNNCGGDGWDSANGCSCIWCGGDGITSWNP